MTREELTTLTNCTLVRARSSLADVFNEFRSRYLDAHSHALIDELEQRCNEDLVDILHRDDVRHSVK
jgi:hypothetical protein